MERKQTTGAAEAITTQPRILGPNHVDTDTADVWARFMGHQSVSAFLALSREFGEDPAEAVEGVVRDMGADLTEQEIRNAIACCMAEIEEVSHD